MAADRKVSASTQNQAFNSILFLYRHILSIDISGEWIEMFNKAGVINIWDEDWSDMDKMLNIRADRKIKNPSDVFSLWEKLMYIFPRVIKNFGLKGLYYLHESQNKIMPLYFNNTLGYCLLRGQKPGKHGGRT